MQLFLPDPLTGVKNHEVPNTADHHTRYLTRTLALRVCVHVLELLLCAGLGTFVSQKKITKQGAAFTPAPSQNSEQISAPPSASDKASAGGGEPAGAAWLKPARLFPCQFRRGQQPGMAAAPRPARTGSLCNQTSGRVTPHSSLNGWMDGWMFR